MKKKKNTPSKECQARWLRWLTGSEEMSKEEAKCTIKRLTALLEHLKLGHADIVYRMKIGKIVMVRASLVNYEKWFHRPFRWENLGYTVPYWDDEIDAWRVFSVSNILDWRPLY